METWNSDVAGKVLLVLLPLYVGMKTNRIRTDINDIVFIFIFVFEYGVGYG